MALYQVKQAKQSLLLDVVRTADTLGEVRLRDLRDLPAAGNILFLLWVMIAWRHFISENFQATYL